MSHFTVLVIGENPEKQLIPFQENNTGDCPKEFLKFNDIEQEYREQYETDTVTKVIMPNGDMLSKWDEKFKVKGAFGIGTGTHKVPEDLEQREIPVKEIYPTFEKYMKDYCGNTKTEDGKYGYWENPNAKWDWYQLGGRWTGFFKLKQNTPAIVGKAGLMTKEADEGFGDQALKSDIDFLTMRSDAEKEAAKNWDEVNAVISQHPKSMTWDEVIEKYKNDMDSARDFYHGQEQLKAFKSIRDGFYDSIESYLTPREEYIKNAIENSISTFAVIKDGVWHEKGKMGWWGMVSGEKQQSEWDSSFNAMIYALPDNTLLSVYDCHI